MLGIFAEAPALPLDEAGKYVAGAYIVFVTLIVIYVAIMAAKLQRIERELRDLAAFAEQRTGSTDVGGSPGGSGREAEQREELAKAGASAGGGGREAEQPPVVQPPTGSDRNLTPSESVGGESRGGGA